MEYTKRRRFMVNVKANDLQDIYQHELLMYDFPPSGEIPFVEFQQLGMERLKLLQHVESIALKSDIKFNERKQSLSTILSKDGLKYFVHLLHAKGCKSSDDTDLQYRRKDHISHFILRLAVCHDSDRQMWFINQEVEWFKLRFSSLDKEEIEKLLNVHDIDCEQITPEEKEEIHEDLRSSTFRTSSIDTVEFYKVPFQRVADLIRSRKVYVSKGIAYIPHPDLMSLFVSYFRKNLIEGMESARLCVSNMYDDERLITFLQSLPGCFSGMARVVWTSSTTPVDKLDELSKTSYPLCMRNLHESLRTHHHLRNSGRIQYGLFLKGIGVTLEDSLNFWRTEFSKKLDSDKFDKQYAYAIRHIYGKEGKRTNYTPFGCPKIISSAVGPGEYHGCPYKHMDQESLKQKLFSYGIPAAGVNEIADLAKDGHYLVACTTYFKITHNQLPDKPIMHPNGYFVESRALLSKNDTTELESKEMPSQGGRLNEKINTTPRRVERTFTTPSRSATGSVRNTDRMGTPSRIVERSNGTPLRTVKETPKKLDLNMEEIAELMNEEV